MLLQLTVKHPGKKILKETVNIQKSYKQTLALHKNFQ